MGILLAALAAAGDEGIKAMNLDQAQANAIDLQQRASDLATAKEKTLIDYKNNATSEQANDDRQQMVDRIGVAKDGIISGVMDRKYGGSDAAVAAAAAGDTDAPLSDDQLAAIQQSKDADRAALDKNSDIATQAAMQTGDIDPKTAATLASRADMAALRAESSQNKTEAMMQIANVKADAQLYMKDLQLQAAKEKAATGGVSKNLATALITSEDVNIKASTSQIGMLERSLPDLAGDRNKAVREQTQAKIQELNDDIKESKQKKNVYLTEMGVLKPPASAGATSTDPSAPIGVRQNNPGNIRNSSGDGFASYPTPQAGFDAISNQLIRYANGKTFGTKIDTVQGIIGKWAPPKNDAGKVENDTPSYINEVAKKLGVAPDAPLNLLNSPTTLTALSAAIAQREIGPAYAERFINPGSYSAPQIPQPTRVAMARPPLSSFVK